MDKRTSHSQELRSLIHSSRQLHSAAARLEGEVSLIELEGGRPAYLKSGANIGRLELVREIEVVGSLQDTSRVPRLLSSEDDGERARMLLSVAAGQPLHQLIGVIDRMAVLDVVADVLRHLWSPEFSDRGWQCGLQAELTHIGKIIGEPGFDRRAFQASSGNVTPEESLHMVRNRLATHRTDVFSHGDLCLPNIIATLAPTCWMMIDLGNAGSGDIFRDLSSLKKSLTRNMDEQAFADLLGLMAIEDDPIKRETYGMLDRFWDSYK